MDSVSVLVIRVMALLILCSGAMSETPGVRKKIKLGYLTGSRKKPDNYFYEKPGQSISGGITLAVQEVNSDPDVLPDHELEFVIAETYGEELESIKQTVNLMRQNLSAYIGPQETCLHEARIAAAFNKPMISYFCTNHEVSDKKDFTTFARTKPHDSQISMAIVSLLLKFNWKKVVFVYNEQKPMLASTIQDVLTSYDIQVTDTKGFEGPYFPDTMVNASPFIKIVHETYQKTRVYVMLADFYEFEGLLIALRLKGLLDTGEYIVVGVDPKQYDSSDPQKYIEGYFHKDPKGVSYDVAEAFRGFLFVAPASPVYPWFANFTEIVNYYLEAPPFNFTNPFGHIDGILKILRPEAAYLYDAVWIYARAAHEAIKQGYEPSDGRAILEYIKGTSYLSAMGYMNHIDENGDSQGNFTLLARKSAPEGYGMYPVGSFLLNHNDTKLPEPVLLAGETIDWIGGAPPVDEPECGFLGEKCMPGPSGEAAASQCVTLWFDDDTDTDTLLTCDGISFSELVKYWRASCQNEKLNKRVHDAHRRRNYGRN